LYNSQIKLKFGHEPTLTELSKCMARLSSHKGSIRRFLSGLLSKATKLSKFKLLAFLNFCLSVYAKEIIMPMYNL